MQSVFSIQRFIEDYLVRLGLEDTDQYSVRLANLYEDHRCDYDYDDFLERISRIRTVVFRNNRGVTRGDVEGKLVASLDRRFMGKGGLECPREFPGGLVTERRRLERQKRRSLSILLGEFKQAVEAKALDGFWESRKRGKLKAQPEVIGQALLAIFLKGVLRNGNGIVLREIGSGIGFVDVGVIFGSVLHLVEIKMLHNAVVGVEQLHDYMRHEQRPEGWLVLFDCRPAANRSVVPTVLNNTAGTVRVLTIDINPVAPSRKNI